MRQLNLLVKMREGRSQDVGVLDILCEKLDLKTHPRILEALAKLCTSI